MDKMEKYENLNLEIIAFENEDVITISDEGEGDDTDS